MFSVLKTCKKTTLEKNSYLSHPIFAESFPNIKNRFFLKTIPKKTTLTELRKKICKEFIKSTNNPLLLIQRKDYLRGVLGIKRFGQQGVRWLGAQENAAFSDQVSGKYLLKDFRPS